MRNRSKKRWMLVGGIALLLLVGCVSRLPAIGAGLILHPPKRDVVVGPPPGCENVTFRGEGVVLKGWKCKAVGERRGTLIYLHGFADNRASGAGVFGRFRRRGFDVVAYDSRAHGDSGGSAVTYGYFEKKDLRRVIDTLEPGPVVLLGSSLGAAVALQLAADDPRVSAVVAAETFSDLQTVVKERAPLFFTEDAIAESIGIAEKEGKFEMDEVSPELAAKRIKVPVLLIHGEDDSATPPGHSRRVFAQLGEARKLILVPGAGHNESMGGDVWKDVEGWIDTSLGGP